MYFKCISRLVEIFRVWFEYIFEFEGNRVIVFCLDDKVFIEVFKYCIKVALIYYKVKYLLILGI